MTDPIYQKLKADAEVMLVDLWRTLSHQAPVEEWQHPRAMPVEAGKPQPDTDPSRRQDRSSGLCYFHLN